MFLGDTCNEHEVFLGNFKEVLLVHYRLAQMNDPKVTFDVKGISPLQMLKELIPTNWFGDVILKKYLRFLIKYTRRS